MEINLSAAKEVLKKNGTEPVMAASIFLAVAFAAFGIVADVGTINVVLIALIPVLQGLITRKKTVSVIEHEIKVEEALNTPVPEEEKVEEVAA